MQLADTEYWVAFSMVAGIGSVRARRLEEHFGSLREAWSADSASLRAAGLDERTVARVLRRRPQISPAELLQGLKGAGIRALAMSDPAYPQRLLEIPSPPMVLYVRGELRPEDEWSVAIVGTRRASSYGRDVAGRLARGLAANGITVISGLARGIDAVAHTAALEAGGRSVAVLGSGVDQLYPWENRQLAERMMGQGAVVSEYPPGTPPDARNFPPRNRIITGLSLGLIVVEAGLQSGAMISAGFAAEQGREVMAVPGSITSPSSLGVNYLLKQGAKLITGVDDVLEELNLQRVAEHREARQTVTSDPTEQKIVAKLTTEPVHVDDLSRELGLPVSAVTGALTLMELKGLARSVGGMQYVAA